jgi:hypothetical protein
MVFIDSICVLNRILRLCKSKFAEVQRYRPSTSKRKFSRRFVAAFIGSLDFVRTMLVSYDSTVVDYGPIVVRDDTFAMRVRTLEIADFMVRLLVDRVNGVLVHWPYELGRLYTMYMDYIA